MAEASVATFAVRRVVLPAWTPIGVVQQAKMLIAPEDGSSGPIYIPFSPSAISHDNIAAEWAKVNRPGRLPTLVYLNEQLPTMSFNLFVTDKKIRRLTGGAPGDFWALSQSQVVESAMSTISTLRTYARLGTRLRVTYGALESGVWRITNYSVDSERRDPNTNEITSAAVSVEMTRVSDVIVGLGPVTGGVQPPPSTTPPASAPARSYTVKSGDTLWSISIKYYGTGSKWTKIADANGIKDPKSLKVGKVLRIP